MLVIGRTPNGRTMGATVERRFLTASGSLRQAYFFGGMSAGACSPGSPGSDLMYSYSERLSISFSSCTLNHGIGGPTMNVLANWTQSSSLILATVSRRFLAKLVPHGP